MNIKSRLHAQNVVEICLLAAVIVVITISVATIYNNQKVKMANLSKSQVVNGHMDASSVNLKTMTAEQSSKKMNYTVTTAGALSSMFGMSETEFNDVLSNITYGQIKAALSSGTPDMLSLANDLGANMSGDVVNASTLDTLVNILKDIPATGRTETQQSYVDRFQSLIDAAKGSKV